MIANIQRVESNVLATFERHLNHSIEDVWAMLTDNEKLKQWFAELRVEELRKGGFILFDMQNGTFIKMEILELKINEVLEFTWDKDVVRFELNAKPEGCLLIFKEKINNLTDHTPRDLAGWHVCLDVIEALLNGETIENRKAEWEKWYPKYMEAISENK
ncbi:SRPBCC family protein [Bacillus sp. FJAT-50079]|uniref:SRPBCC family protein n=1 Tax=Bacillus sp. FJAT-50079 TaxID=2833577 RepID=UPI001BC94134|nr:SRPBCC family protein [Bacillus sp. FJAT-50079]MBS4210043.1 SRPBCC family protein [Bacillus sp. FJAT-50079]